MLNTYSMSTIGRIVTPPRVPRLNAVFKMTSWTRVFALGLIVGGATLSGCSSSPALPTNQIGSSDIVDGTHLAWNALISPALPEYDRTLMRHALLNTPVASRGLLRNSTAVYLIVSTEHEDSIFVNRPELQGSLIRFSIDRSNPGEAISSNAQRVPVPAWSADIEPESLSALATPKPVEPYRKILSVPGYAHVSVTVAPPCNDKMFNGDAVFLYTGGYSTTGNSASELEAGIGNRLVNQASLTDYVPYVRGLGGIFYAVSNPIPSGFNRYGANPPYYYRCGLVFMNFIIWGGCVDKSLTNFTVADPPCGTGLQQYEEFEFQSCYAEAFVGGWYLCNPAPTTTSVEILYLKVGNTVGWTNSCKSCVVQRVSGIAQHSPSNDGSSTGETDWFQAGLAPSTSSGHSWDKASTQYCKSVPSGPACTVTPPHSSPTVVSVQNFELGVPPGTYDYANEWVWITQLK